MNSNCNKGFGDNLLKYLPVGIPTVQVISVAGGPPCIVVLL